VLAPTHPDGATRRAAQGPEGVEDLLFLLDHLSAVWRRLAPELAGRVDGRAVGVAGHSFGGRTSAELASQDDRVKALLTMAGGAARRTAAALFLTYLAHRHGASAPLDPARVHDPRLRLTAVGMP
jgi:predicted dienelactone hydrolase